MPELTQSTIIAVANDAVRQITELRDQVAAREQVITAQQAQLDEIRDALSLPNFTHEVVLYEIRDDMAARAEIRELLGLISTASNTTVLEALRQLIERRG